jgi:hypothetical protein
MATRRIVTVASPEPSLISVVSPNRTRHVRISANCRQ